MPETTPIILITHNLLTHACKDKVSFFCSTTLAFCSRGRTVIYNFIHLTSPSNMLKSLKNHRDSQPPFLLTTSCERLATPISSFTQKNLSVCMGVVKHHDDVILRTNVPEPLPYRSRI